MDYNTVVLQVDNIIDIIVTIGVPIRGRGSA